jgi:hypothetical protein
MPRPPRDLAPGIHHIGSGAAGPATYYLDEIDHALWLRLFVRTIERHGWDCLIVVQLTTHWHAIVETHDHSLAEGMQYLNGEYSKRFNKRHTRVGYLVRDRYWSRRKSTEAELLNAFCYAANNPVFAGLAARAEGWKWSSFATSVGLEDSFSFVKDGRVLRQFGRTKQQAQPALRHHVAALASAALGRT